MPSFDATVSETTVPTNASVIATLSDAKKYGSERGSPTLNRMSHPRRAERAQHVLELGLERREPGGDVDDDREEADQERGEDRRARVPMPNHTTRIGTNAAFGMLLNATSSG